MTLKYESEILFDLMKRDGDDTPSDVLPYESELKEKYLEQVEGAYPKLMDYRPEWLFYNLYSHLPADFPVESLSNVTEATVNHVVPYAYGRASLKGQTLVNLLDRNRMTASGLTYTFANGDYTINTSKTWAKMEYKPILVKNKKYLVMLSTSIPDVIIYYRNSSNEATRICAGTQCPFVFTNPVDNLATVSIEFPTMVTNGKVSRPMIIEYQDGMENWDVSYFEGMKSVQMPGLTTTGKNLFDYSSHPITLEKLAYSHGNEVQWTGYIGIKTYVPVKENTAYTYSNDINVGIRYGLVFYDGDKNVLSYIDTFNTNRFTSFTTPKGCKFIRFAMETQTIPQWIQLEEATSPTSYEPFKSIILTANEEVELRGIGDVKDELNCLTGEVTQRVGEVTFKGALDEGWGRFDNTAIQEQTCLFVHYGGLPSSPSDNLQMICDKFIISKDGYSTLLNTDKEMIHVYSDKAVYFRILKSKLSTQNVDGFKKWLSQNPFTIQYQLKTESVKTVDLTVTDQDGNADSIIRPLEGTMHLMTEGDTFKPLFSGEVPVEAITQNLMSFVNIEEEE